MTGRIGYAFGASGRTRIYGKGGFSWAKDEVDIALNALDLPGVRAVAPGNISNHIM